MNMVLVILAISFLLLYFLTFIDKDKPGIYRLKKAGVAILIFLFAQLLIIGAGVFILQEQNLNEDDLFNMIIWLVAGSVIAGFILAIILAQRLVK